MDALNTHKQNSMERETYKKINEWLQYVRGRVVGNKRRQVYYNTIPVDWISKERLVDMAINEPSIQTEDMMVVEIPVRELATMTQTQEWYQQNIGGFPMERFDKIIRDKHNEEYLRKQHPGLQESWEKYQIMLALCSNKSFN